MLIQLFFMKTLVLQSPDFLKIHSFLPIVRLSLMTKNFVAEWPGAAVAAPVSPGSKDSPPVRFPVSHLKFGQKLHIKCLSIASSSPYSEFGESLGLKGILRPILCIDINTHSDRK